MNIDATHYFFIYFKIDFWHIMAHVKQNSSPYFFISLFFKRLLYSQNAMFVWRILKHVTSMTSDVHFKYAMFIWQYAFTIPRNICFMTSCDFCNQTSVMFIWFQLTYIQSRCVVFTQMVAEVHTLNVLE